jgi:hypothetical protein
MKIYFFIKISRKTIYTIIIYLLIRKMKYKKTLKELYYIR